MQLEGFKPLFSKIVSTITDRIQTKNIQDRQQQSETRAEQSLAPNLIPDDGGDVVDETPLARFIVENFATLLDRSTGSELFPSLDALLNSAKVFVQDTVANTARPCHLTPREIFTLFIFGLNSNIQKCCVKAMREFQDSFQQNPQEHGAAKSRAVKWIPMIRRTQKALLALPPITGTFLYRSVRLDDEKAVMRLLRARAVGSTFATLPFQTVSPDVMVAAAWCYGGTVLRGRPACGVVYKILPHKRARDISRFTLTTWQREATFLMGTEFRVVRHLDLQSLQIEDTSVIAGGAIDTSFCRSVELKKVNHNTVPPVVVIELEEVGSMQDWKDDSFKR